MRWNYIAGWFMLLLAMFYMYKLRIYIRYCFHVVVLYWSIPLPPSKISWGSETVAKPELDFHAVWVVMLALLFPGCSSIWFGVYLCIWTSSYHIAIHRVPTKSSSDCESALEMRLANRPNQQRGEKKIATSLATDWQTHSAPIQTDGLRHNGTLRCLGLGAAARVTAK